MTRHCWAVVPAAGIGRRFGTEIPKQYLDLLGKPVLLHTLERLMAVPEIAGVTVALAAQDPWWPGLARDWPKPLRVVTGGAERVHSVANAVRTLRDELADDDWILVHDAARPCVRIDDIRRLLVAVANDPVGGLLGTPVRDTMKQVDGANHVTVTVDRSRLWHALTPQVFRAGVLETALATGLADPARITDEASALERGGWQPLMVEGSATNLKITHPDDLALAEFYLRRHAEA
ncbi:MAG: 2-C-methyl-D-erythritol 4-phosphate cytidylyltransferase [Thiotrichales bacterium]